MNGASIIDANNSIAAIGNIAHPNTGINKDIIVTIKVDSIINDAAAPGVVAVAFRVWQLGHSTLLLLMLCSFIVTSAP